MFLTNDPSIDPADVPFEYNGRASIEALIAELKQAWAIGKIPSETFLANHAIVLDQAARAQPASSIRTSRASGSDADLAC